MNAISNDQILDAALLVNETVNFNRDFEIYYNHDIMYVAINSLIKMKWLHHMSLQSQTNSILSSKDRFISQCKEMAAKILQPTIDAMHKYNCKQVILTGYADGGTIARILALSLDVKMPISIITFGEPRMSTQIPISQNIISDDRVIMYGDGKVTAEKGYIYVYIIPNVELTRDLDKWESHCDIMSKYYDVYCRQHAIMPEIDCEMRDYLRSIIAIVEEVL